MYCHNTQFTGCLIPWIEGQLKSCTCIFHSQWIEPLTLHFSMVNCTNFFLVT